MTDFPHLAAVDLDFAEGWLTVWFNEPEKRNPLTDARVADLKTLCAHLADRRDVRGVAFRGRGGVFCAGGDLKSFKAAFQGGGDPEQVIAMSKGGAALFDAVDALPQFTVMAVEGAAMAGGFGMVCCGDMVIVENGAKFSFSETAIGLSPAQISPFVLRRLGLNAGRRLMLSAESLNAEQALALGLADELAEGAQGVDAALARVRSRVKRCAPGALADTKELILALGHLTREQQVQAAAENFARRMLSEEGREGVASFTEKRKPRWASEDEA